MAKKRTTKAKPRAKARAARRPARPAPKKMPAPAAKRAPAPPSAKSQFLQSLDREHRTTLKVMRAYPAHQHGLQPHPRSSSAKQLMWTFVIEQEFLRAALNGTLSMPPAFPSAPETIPEIIAAYETGVADVKTILAKTPDAKLANTVPFPVGPKQMGQVPLGDLLWMMLLDSIHHRGQLSVYLRMAGGLVPSIYGPSADEPWN